MVSKLKPQCFKKQNSEHINMWGSRYKGSLGFGHVLKEPGKIKDGSFDIHYLNARTASASLCVSALKPTSLSLLATLLIKSTPLNLRGEPT